MIPGLGLYLVAITPEQAEPFRQAGVSPGAVIVIVESGLARAAGFQVGDVLAAINGQNITTEDELRRTLRALGPGKSRYLIRRGKETLTVEIDCPAYTPGSSAPGCVAQ